MATGKIKKKLADGGFPDEDEEKLFQETDEQTEADLSNPNSGGGGEHGEYVDSGDDLDGFNNGEQGDEQEVVEGTEQGTDSSGENGKKGKKDGNGSDGGSDSSDSKESGEKGEDGENKKGEKGEDKGGSDSNDQSDSGSGNGENKESGKENKKGEGKGQEGSEDKDGGKKSEKKGNGDNNGGDGEKGDGDGDGDEKEDKKGGKKKDKKSKQPQEGDDESDSGDEQKDEQQNEGDENESQKEKPDREIKLGEWVIVADTDEANYGHNAKIIGDDARDEGVFLKLESISHSEFEVLLESVAFVGDVVWYKPENKKGTLLRVSDTADLITIDFIKDNKILSQVDTSFVELYKNQDNGDKKNKKDNIVGEQGMLVYMAEDTGKIAYVESFISDWFISKNDYKVNKKVFDLREIKIGDNMPIYEVSVDDKKTQCNRQDIVLVGDDILFLNDENKKTIGNVFALNYDALTITVIVDSKSFNILAGNVIKSIQNKKQEEKEVDVIVGDDVVLKGENGVVFSIKKGIYNIILNLKDSHIDATRHEFMVVDEVVWNNSIKEKCYLKKIERFENSVILENDKGERYKDSSKNIEKYDGQDKEKILLDDHVAVTNPERSSYGSNGRINKILPNKSYEIFLFSPKDDDDIVVQKRDDFSIVGEEVWFTDEKKKGFITEINTDVNNITVEFKKSIITAYTGKFEKYTGQENLPKVGESVAIIDLDNDNYGKNGEIARVHGGRYTVETYHTKMTTLLVRESFAVESEYVWDRNLNKKAKITHISTTKFPCTINVDYEDQDGGREKTTDNFVKYNGQDESGDEIKVGDWIGVVMGQNLGKNYKVTKVINKGEKVNVEGIVGTIKRDYFVINGETVWVQQMKQKAELFQVLNENLSQRIKVLIKYIHPDGYEVIAIMLTKEVEKYVGQDKKKDDAPTGNKEYSYVKRVFNKIQDFPLFRSSGLYFEMIKYNLFGYKYKNLLADLFIKSDLDAKWEDDITDDDRQIDYKLGQIMSKFISLKPYFKNKQIDIPKLFYFLFENNIKTNFQNSIQVDNSVVYIYLQRLKAENKKVYYKAYIDEKHTGGIFLIFDFYIDNNVYDFVCDDKYITILLSLFDPLMFYIYNKKDDTQITFEQKSDYLLKKSQNYLIAMSKK